jgi:hypothetical protein
VHPRDGTDRSGPDPLRIASEPSFSVKIHSPAIMNALRSVVKYYPSQDLSDGAIIEEPYAVVAHHFSELDTYANDRVHSTSDQDCVLDKFATSHVRALLDFVDKRVMVGFRAEKERNARGFYTYKYSWVSRRPGYTILFKSRGAKHWEAGVIMSTAGGPFTDPPSQWTTEYWNLRYNGTYLVRTSGLMYTSISDGEASFEQHSTIILPGQEIGNAQNPVIEKLIRNGRMYCRLIEKQCMYHRGENILPPIQMIDGLVMADADMTVNTEQDEDLSTDDLRSHKLRCPCPACQIKDQPKDGDDNVKPLFEDYDNLAPPCKGGPELTNHQCLLCPSEMRMFVFKTRRWLLLDVANLSEPEWDESMVDNLIMDQSKKQTLMSLSKSFSRTSKAAETLTQPFWSADFVAGKGTGLTFLFHGKPGVGKTLTAECIAAFTRRPLLVLTSSDIGTSPEQVEVNLTRQFIQAKSWGAVILIDEADVFMERRSTSDLLRNSLVAGFLRALEYYEGILFLTTNRVGSFDDAFISRVHVQLYYPDFTDEQRQLVWKTFIKKLERERKGYMRLSLAAKEYIQKSGMSNLKWNGREIRNAFQTAVSLAEYEGEKDEEGVILVTDEHLQAVVELSKGFKDYLNELHTVDEDKRAEQRFERIGSYREEGK